MRKLIFTSLVALICWSGVNASSAPEIIVSCGESKGHVYFHHNEYVSKKDSGWAEDRVKDGSFFVQKSGENYDLIYRTKLGLSSSADDGAIIMPTHRSEKSLSLVVIYPSNGNTEVYNFQHINTKNAEATWTQTKVGTLIVKSGVFRASCNDGK